MPKEHMLPAVALGAFSGAADAALADLAGRDIIGRIWRRDHTVWKPSPAEIADRLGWLTIASAMRAETPALRSFADRVREAGYRHAVLLGMGGSSLGAEVLRQTFGNRPGYPELIVLDSTIPEAIKAVAAGVDFSHTLFIVSSKSGTTVEPLSLMRYFWNEVEAVVGRGRAGGSFVAITDAGTPLARLAGEQGFRRTFLNQSDIGGRYSVLSYFGLVPAALTGIDTAALLERAAGMQQACGPLVRAGENPGAWLGAVIGALAQRGRDKLTVVTSPGSRGYRDFGLWLEQLIAESTGKEGKGIVPIVGEPLVDPDSYGEDRLFVYLRLAEDQNEATDTAVERIRAAGQPLAVIELQDRYDLGAEFFRWEFAVAVAGAVLGINPFDQPDVQRAKEATDRVLREYVASGRLPIEADGMMVRDLLHRAGKGKYLAVMAYLRQTPETDLALSGLRQNVLERMRIATTSGYGPRFLHSTGQLYKGGPDTGLFLQITAKHREDLPVPGQPYSFGVLADAQALGDRRALEALGRNVTSVRLAQADVRDIERLAEEV